MKVALISKLLEQEELTIGLYRIRLRVGHARIDTRMTGTSSGVALAFPIQAKEADECQKKSKKGEESNASGRGMNLQKVGARGFLYHVSLRLNITRSSNFRLWATHGDENKECSGRTKYMTDEMEWKTNV